MRGRAQINQKERRANHQRKHNDQAAPTADSVSAVEEKVSEPLVRHPGRARARKGKRISVRNGSGLRDDLASLKMPPHIGIADAARRQGKDPQQNNGEESTFGG